MRSPSWAIAVEKKENVDLHDGENWVLAILIALKNSF
jgi:hypothetical protein